MIWSTAVVTVVRSLEFAKVSAALNWHSRSNWSHWLLRGSKHRFDGGMISLAIIYFLSIVTIEPSCSVLSFSVSLINFKEQSAISPEGWVSLVFSWLQAACRLFADPQTIQNCSANPSLHLLVGRLGHFCIAINSYDACYLDYFKYYSQLQAQRELWN